MTYCVAITLEAGMIFASDSRTNAGVDQIATFTKMRLSKREQAMIAGDTAAYFETIAKRLRAEMADAPEWLH